MTQAQFFIQNESNKAVLTELSLAIEEARLVRRISGIGDDIRRIENLPEEAARVQYLRREIAMLKDELTSTILLK